MKKTIALLSLLIVIATQAIAQNQLQEGLALKYLVQLPAEKSAHPPVVLLLHGYGSDEKDLFGLRTAFPKNYLIIAARAPYALPGGTGYQWYESATVNGHHDGNKDQLSASRSSIIKFIAQVVSRYNADGRSVYVAGFSQGAIMSYQVGLTDPGNIKGIGVLSGMVFPSLKAIVKTTSALKNLRIFIAHGTADNRILFTDGQAAYDYIKTLRLTADFHQYPGMSHTISNEELSDFVKWLK